MQNTVTDLVLPPVFINREDHVKTLNVSGIGQQKTFINRLPRGTEDYFLTREIR